MGQRKLTGAIRGHQRSLTPPQPRSGSSEARGWRTASLAVRAASAARHAALPGLRLSPSRHIERWRLGPCPRPGLAGARGESPRGSWSKALTRIRGLRGATALTRASPRPGPQTRPRRPRRDTRPLGRRGAERRGGPLAAAGCRQRPAGARVSIGRSAEARARPSMP